MFDKEFYPTPERLIKKMLKPYFKKKKVWGFNNSYNRENYDFDGLTILEPSAGKGNILDFITNPDNNIYRSKENEVYAIEKNVELQSILREKNYPIISTDFMDYNDEMYFDLIIMNPPFSKGAKHLLKAFEVAKKSKIICLLNSETIKNPYTSERKLLKNLIEKYNGHIEILKDEFKDSERQTGVEIALITVDVHKEGNRFDFNFETENEEKLDFDIDMVENEIARQDLIGNLNLRYEEVRSAYADLIEAEMKYKYLKNIFIDGEGYHSTSDWELKDGSPERRYNYLSNKMKAFMWKSVISELDMKKYMSNKVLRNFEAFIRQQSKMSFTKENVANFFQMIMNNRVNIWDQAVVDVFEMMTDYYKGNRKHIEGWKTNDKYKVNRKIILPDWVEYDASYLDASYLKSNGAKMKIDFRTKDKFNDIDKVMAYLVGDKLSTIETVNYSLEKHFELIGNIKTGQKFINKVKSKYFNIKFYKKGTVHLEFRDKKLWEKFNLTACSGKNWLPENEEKEYQKSKNYNPSDNRNDKIKLKQISLF
jgi:hypothetical protein